ncbi:unnamed protein product [Tetraodon nigroviridis]|uniref:(spotted green pufferfish) hypothetical protein n=1 Tax=Tetraodon nigroviridis TaxID=99883 RepID=Q4RPM6_TETNG|nr:unnamed protein product [Tetraodon nigroviridis]
MAQRMRISLFVCCCVLALQCLPSTLCSPVRGSSRYKVAPVSRRMLLLLLFYRRRSSEAPGCAWERIRDYFLFEKVALSSIIPILGHPSHTRAILRCFCARCLNKNQVERHL